MANRIFDDVDIQNIANAIREKNGSSNTYLVSEMGDAIRDIPIPEPKLGTLEVTENGTYKASEYGGSHKETFVYDGSKDSNKIIEIIPGSEMYGLEIPNAAPIVPIIDGVPDISVIKTGWTLIDTNGSEPLTIRAEDLPYYFPDPQYYIDVELIDGLITLVLNSGGQQPMMFFVPINFVEVLMSLGLPQFDAEMYASILTPGSAYIIAADPTDTSTKLTFEYTTVGGEPIDGFSEVVVNVPAVGFYTTEENESGGLTYRFSAEKSDVVEFNIAYGDTEPTDTSKLWVKTTKPTAVKVSKDIEKVPSDDCTAVVVESIQKPKYSGSAQIGTKIYMFSGYYNYNYTTSVFSYDIENQTLAELATQVPQVISYSTASAIGTKIYIFGGCYGTSTPYNKIYCFDTVTETMSTINATLPNGVCSATSVSIGSKIYIFGGDTLNNSTYDGITNQIICFDSESLTASKLTTVMPIEIHHTACVAYENSIYLFGGIDKSGNTIKTILKFDCETETITTCATTLPKALSSSCCVLMEKTIVILGGRGSDSIYLFDCNSETLTLLDVTLPEKKSMAYVGVLDNSVWLLGGISGWFDESNKTILFTLGMSVVLDADTVQIQSTPDKNIFNLINTDNMQVEIGVMSVLKGNADGIGEQVEAALHNGTSWVTI